MNYAILTHGGAASPHHFSDGCIAAAERARAVLDEGGDALAAALAATVALEDDPRFNAGTGSNLRLDGRTIEMDASAMSSDGRFGAVACIQSVQNPVLVAARVMETPHLMLVGEGATAFARRLGFPTFDPTTEGAKKKYARALAELAGHGDGDYAVDADPFRRMDLAKVWNFDGEPPPVARITSSDVEGCDTVGAVVRDRHGRFAATASTGGTLYMLKGRVGDSPLMGAGVYAGPHGAVACTGVGEEIARRFLAKTVYDWLVEDVSPARAAQRAVAMFPDVIDAGLLVAGREGQAVASNRNMASAMLVG
ncbi:Isoaspartyl aminopeptidase [Minicystis rosea]|nr:Isoaspartyl aminopeptidase [Minicystis rosea]